ncbi:MAG: molybdate ABC transporter substrate-binding protein [Anaerolineae bacterium]|nr:molybdate ABC transporter substrate-binding protein [Anaerolineae bacterium]
MKYRFYLLALVLIATLTFGLRSSEAQETQTLTVFAAASLTDAFTEIAANFQTENSDVEIVFNFANSSALAAQLSEGAPADIFASANQRQMQVAIDGERIAEPTAIFARNRLVVVVPADNPANIQTLNDLAKPGLLLILVASGAPIRDYTDAMLEMMAVDPAYGEDYREAVLENIVSEEDNVRQVTAKVALGEADAGIVYLSDITPDVNEAVIHLPIPDAFNTIATYPIGITTDSPNPELAQAFVDYILSDSGQAVLLDWNFLGKCPLVTEPDVTPEATPETTPSAEETETRDDAGCS